MHGAGNDYIYVNTLKYPIESPKKLSVEWSAPHTGIGSDGLVLIGSSDKADFSMRIFNADGSEAKMCAFLHQSENNHHFPSIQSFLHSTLEQ